MQQPKLMPLQVVLPDLCPLKAHYTVKDLHRFTFPTKAETQQFSLRIKLWSKSLDLIVPASVNSQIILLTSKVQSALPLGWEVGRLHLYTNVSLKCQSSSERSGRYDVFLLSLHTCLHTCSVTFWTGHQMDPWQRNQSPLEREVGQQRSILDGEREVVGGRVNSGQARAHAAVFSLLPASHADSLQVFSVLVISSFSFHRPSCSFSSCREHQ